MDLIVIWLSLCSYAVTSATTYVVDIYQLDPKSGGIFEKAVIDNRSQKIYVGAKNKLYEFDSNLEVLTEVITGPKDDNLLCPIRKFSCTSKKIPTDSHSKAILIDYVHDHLIHCTSLYQGTCLKHHLTNIKDTDDPIYTIVVANNDSATTFAFIAPGPIQDENGLYSDVLNVGVQYTAKGWLRDRIPCFASRNLNFDLAYDDISLFRSQTRLDSTLRQLFPILYVYGFSSQGFSYMITVQKQSSNTESYITKIFRVCQRDKNFYSYAEVHLQCSSKGVVYNLSQTAYLGKAGRKLAKTLDIPITEDVLYVTFSVGIPRSNKPTQESALCIYPMRDIRTVFTQNIQKCFEGEGNTGPAHFFSSAPCRATPVSII